MTKSTEPQPADDGIVYDLDDALGAFDWRAAFPGGAAGAVDQFLADLESTPRVTAPYFADGCSVRIGHRCGECRLGLGRHDPLDPYCDFHKGES